MLDTRMLYDTHRRVGKRENDESNGAAGWKHATVVIAWTKKSVRAFKFAIFYGSLLNTILNAMFVVAVPRQIVSGGNSPTMACNAAVLGENAFEFTPVWLGRRD